MTEQIIIMKKWAFKAQISIILLEQQNEILISTEVQGYNQLMASSSTTVIFFVCLVLAMDLIVTQNISEVLQGHQQKIFQNFKSKFAKKYKDASQELYRNLIVFKNAKIISNHNLNKLKPYTLGLNQFSDLTQDQFKLTYTKLMVPDQKAQISAQNESKKIELSENLCECDQQKVNKIAEIEQNQETIKNDLIINAINKGNKRNIKLAQINKNISQFQSKISTLSAEEYNVTVTKMKKDASKSGSNIIIPTLANTASTGSLSIASTGNGNLKKNDQTALPSSLTGLVSSPQQLNQKLSSINSNNYGSDVLSSVGMTSLNKGTTQSTNTISATVQNTSEAEKVLNSLGNQQIVGPLLGQGLASPLLASNTSTTTSSTSTSTTSTTNSLSPSPSAVIASITVVNGTEWSIDWSNYTGGVRYQGSCGSCYALAAVANVQTLLYVYTFGFAIQLSAQQIIECANNSFTFGCEGGYLEGSYLFMKSNGVTTEYVYPYRSAANGTVGTCKTLSGPFKIVSFKNLPQNDCASLKIELRKKPVSLGIASSNMQFYQSGVFNDCTSNVDHAVLLVGYNTTKGWKIKNTWGSSWGQSGYAWIQDGNSCGICSIPTTPTVASQSTYS